MLQSQAFIKRSNQSQQLRADPFNHALAFDRRNARPGRLRASPAFLHRFTGLVASSAILGANRRLESVILL